MWPLGLALAANCDPLGAGEAAAPWDGRLVTESGLLTEPLLNAGEAAQLLRVPRSTLYELVRTRGLPHIRIGDRALRFTRQDLETWVTENTYGTQRAR
jgi:excisionase family DNA binding protein